jgi:hypothetical protein
MDPIKRRAFMKGAAAGTLAFSVGGAVAFLTPAQARAQGAAFKVLKPEDAAQLEAFADALVPGARQEGIAHFVDQQCSVPPHEALLALRIANGRPPFVNFYRTVLGEIDRQCKLLHGKAFGELAPADQLAFIDLVRQGKITDWKGPPQPQVYGILREDAVDVVYGTVAGFERLGVPYMPHVLPTARW